MDQSSEQKLIIERSFSSKQQLHAMSCHRLVVAGGTKTIAVRGILRGDTAAPSANQEADRLRTRSPAAALSVIACGIGNANRRKTPHSRRDGTWTASGWSTPGTGTCIRILGNVSLWGRINNVPQRSALMQFYEKECWRRTRIAQQRAYFKKLNYLRYATRVVRYAVENNVRFPVCDVSATDTNFEAGGFETETWAGVSTALGSALIKSPADLSERLWRLDEAIASHVGCILSMDREDVRGTLDNFSPGCSDDANARGNRSRVKAAGRRTIDAVDILNGLAGHHGRGGRGLRGRTTSSSNGIPSLASFISRFEPCGWTIWHLRLLHFRLRFLCSLAKHRRHLWARLLLAAEKEGGSLRRFRRMRNQLTLLHDDLLQVEVDGSSSPDFSTFSEDAAGIRTNSTEKAGGEQAGPQRDLSPTTPTNYPLLSLPVRLRRWILCNPPLAKERGGSADHFVVSYHEASEEERKNWEKEGVATRSMKDAQEVAQGEERWWKVGLSRTQLRHIFDHSEGGKKSSDGRNLFA